MRAPNTPVDPDPAQTRGWIFDIQRFSLHDGPGIRTTVFLKGCSLRCLWCHNPEGISPRPLLSFQPERCVSCGACVAVCEREAHQVGPSGHRLDRNRCVICGACVRACPGGAVGLVGRQISAAEVIREAGRDRAFYEASGGGLTLSGGEPLLQAAFAVALARLARADGLHVAVETAGCVPWSHFEPIVPHVDLFLYDLKETDPGRHREFTGGELGPVLDNLRRLHRAGARLRLRLPMVPGLNDRPDHGSRLVALIREMPGLEGVELLPFHRLGTGKRARLGLAPGAMETIPAPEPAAVAGWVRQLRLAGVSVLDTEGL